MKHKNWILAGVLLVVLVSLATVAAYAAAGTPAPAPAVSTAPGPTETAAPKTPSPSPAQTRLTAPATASARVIESSRDWDDADYKTRMQYTQADYELLASLRPEGYLDMSVEAFNRAVFDWTNEERYHALEEPLMRLSCTLKEDDPLYSFLSTTLSYSRHECSLKHYNTCVREEYPSNGGTAKYEKYGDIYGDKVLVASGCAEYSYHYRIKDESGLTVRERDAFFQAIDDGVQSFLDRQTEEALKNEKAMDTALADEMDALVKSLATDRIEVVSGSTYYYWERMW